MGRRNRSGAILGGVNQVVQITTAVALVAIGFFTYRINSSQVDVAKRQLLISSPASFELRPYENGISIINRFGLANDYGTNLEFYIQSIGFKKGVGLEYRRTKIYDVFMPHKYNSESEILSYDFNAKNLAIITLALQQLKLSPENLSSRSISFNQKVVANVNYFDKDYRKKNAIVCYSLYMPNSVSIREEVKGSSSNSTINGFSPRISGDKITEKDIQSFIEDLNKNYSVISIEEFNEC